MALTLPTEIVLGARGFARLGPQPATRLAGSLAGRSCFAMANKQSHDRGTLTAVARGFS